MESATAEHRLCTTLCNLSSREHKFVWAPIAIIDANKRCVAVVWVMRNAEIVLALGCALTRRGLAACKTLEKAALLAP